MMQTNVDQFVVQLSDMTRTQNEGGRKVLRGFIFTTARAIVTKEGVWGPGTPVKTSFAANSWRAGVGVPPHGPSSPADGDPVPGPAPDLSVFASIEPGEIGYLGSACVYMPSLEHGHSMQAPGGMVEVVLAQAQNIMDAVAAEIGGRGG